MNADERSIAQQIFESSRAVIRDHDIGRCQIRADVGIGHEVSRLSFHQRAEACRPVDAAGVEGPWIARPIVELDDDVPRPLEQPAHELHSHRVERRCRRPRWSVEHRGACRIEIETGQDGVAPQRAVHQAIDLRHADEARRIARRVDRPGADEVAHAPAVHEEEPVPPAHGRFGPVVVVLEFAGDAVKHLDAASAARQRRPQKIGRQVDVDAFQRRAARRDDGRAGQHRVVNSRDVGAGLA